METNNQRIDFTASGNSQAYGLGNPPYLDYQRRLLRGYNPPGFDLQLLQFYSTECSLSWSLGYMLASCFNHPLSHCCICFLSIRHCAKVTLTWVIHQEPFVIYQQHMVCSVVYYLFMCNDMTQKIDNNLSESWHNISFLMDKWSFVGFYWKFHFLFFRVEVWLTETILTRPIRSPQDGWDVLERANS